MPGRGRALVIEYFSSLRFHLFKVVFIRDCREIGRYVRLVVNGLLMDAIKFTVLSLGGVESKGLILKALMHH